MKIRIIDDLSPEDLAMLQALYSRSNESVDVHLKKVKETGSGKFAEKFYVNFNHKSIADCGDTTMFIEGVSLLAAKAIQDNPLYSGQETSTRFIDMSRQLIIDPVQTERTQRVLGRWMAFYMGAQIETAAEVRRRYPKQVAEDQTRYDNAVKARVFDILRGFLPAGITTQLSWHTNLRQAGDKLATLQHHPAKEIRDIAAGLMAGLNEKYHTSFSGAVSGFKASEDLDKWNKLVGEDLAYLPTKGAMTFGWFLQPDLVSYTPMFESRPRGAVLPHFLDDMGQFVWRFELDFGSFRDLQRHRKGVVRMPLLGQHVEDQRFESWYLEQLSDEVRTQAERLLEEQAICIDDIAMEHGGVVAQYYCPLGYKVPCQVTFSLPAAVYVMELRSSKTVHPTLRKVVHGMIEHFVKVLPEVKLHCDLDPDDWTMRRGGQTITEKK